MAPCQMSKSAIALQGLTASTWTRPSFLRACLADPRLTLPMASSPLSNRKKTPRTVNKHPNPVRPTPISAGRSAYDIARYGLCGQQ